MARNDGTVLLEDARIIFRNFAGKEGQYNREGDRNFGVILDHETADILERDGWNVKTLQAREEGDVDQPWLSVAVKYGTRGQPPKVVLVTSRGQTLLGEDQVEMLDWADITMVDMIIRPYQWEVNGATGIKAYLKSIYVTIEEDPLEMKYGVVPGDGEDEIHDNFNE